MRARSAPSPPSRSRSSRATEDGSRGNPELAIFRRRASPLRRGTHALCRRHACGLAARRRGRGLPRAGQGARRGRLPQGGGAGRARRAASQSRRAHALSGARDFGLPRRPVRLCLRHAGPGHRLDLAVRLAGAQGALSAAGARRARHRRLRAVRAGGGLRCRRPGDDGQGRRRLAPAHRRQQDLDFQRRDCRSLRRIRAHRRRRPAPRGSPPSWSMPMRPD